jgi:hypothetical protein
MPYSIYSSNTDTIACFYESRSSLTHILVHNDPVRQVKRMLKECPDDVRLQKRVKTLEAKLVQAKRIAAEHETDADNPLKYSIDTFALTASDIEGCVML